MAVTKISNSSLKNLNKYDSFLAGNPAYIPSSFDSIATIAGSGTSVTFSSIPSTYKHLQIRFIARDTSANLGLTDFYMQFNGNSSASYNAHRMDGDGTSVGGTGSGSSFQTNIEMTIASAGGNNTSGIHGVGIIDIIDYADTSKNKMMRMYNGGDFNDSNGRICLQSGFWNSTTALSSITLYRSFGNWSGSTSFALYGIKG